MIGALRAAWPGWAETLFALSTLFYFLGGLGGWLLCVVAWFSRRFRPALTPAGIGIGLVPGYILLIRVLRETGHLAPGTTIPQYLAACLIVATVLAMVAVAFVFTVGSIVDERRADRLARAAGC